MISSARDRTGSARTSKADPAVRAVARDIARVRRRIAELEALAADDTPNGASLELVQGLAEEWRARLRAMENRRDTLLRTISDPDRQTPLPAFTSTTLPARRLAAIWASMLIERYGMERSIQVATRLAAGTKDAVVARSWRRVEEFIRRKMERADRRQ